VDVLVPVDHSAVPQRGNEQKGVPSVLATTDIQRLEGCEVVDLDDQKIGSIDAIYVDDESGAPEFALVKSGVFGTKSRFVPVREADEYGDGVRVPYSKDQVKDAPSCDPDGHLSQTEEAKLYEYYGLAYGQPGYPAGQSTTGQTPGKSDDAMTRSEEELRIGTEKREAGRVRLRKYVTTEQQTKTVPVTKEQVRVEREPITDANRDQAMSGPEITESEHEVTVTEEEPVVEKRAVPKERVRLEKDAETEQREVSEDVRKEQIEVDDPTGKANR
jgi:uncharacterized protein (TIGR02271 family)